MQRDLVERRGWFTQDEYLQGLAVAQTLPGPLAAQLAMWLGYVRRGTAGATACALAFVLPPFLIVTVVAAIYVSLAGTTMIQALFYGIGPTVIVLILRGAWKLLRVTVKSDRRLWAIFAVVALAHLARIVQGWQVQLGGIGVAMSVSWIALAASAALAVWGGALLRRSGSKA